jgi:hypothetical protein
MAKGAGGGGGSMGMHGHGHMGHHHHHFRNNPFLFGGWGWGGYGDSGYTNTTVVVSPPPVSRFPAADVTGSIATMPCHWNTEAFTVPSSGGGTQPVQVVGCR